MADRENQSVQRRRLSAVLRKAREDVPLTQSEAAGRLDWSLSKLIRIEAGTVGVSVSDLRAMLVVYRLTDRETVRSLVEAARGSRGRSWRGKYRDLISPQFAQYLGYESSASVIRVSHPYLIPGLLQIEEYASALADSHHEASRDPRVAELRMERQRRLLDQAEPPELKFAFNQEALHRWIGGPQAMQRQLLHLLEMNARSNVSIQIIPFGAGAHPGLLTPFLLLSFDADDDLLFIESTIGNMMSKDDRETIGRYTKYFEMLRAHALSQEQTNRLINSVIRSLDSVTEDTAYRWPPATARQAGEELVLPLISRGIQPAGDHRGGAFRPRIPKTGPKARSSAPSAPYRAEEDPPIAVGEFKNKTFVSP